MVGKLNLDLGDDYAFDIRRAREVAENAGGGGTGGINSNVPIGPYSSPNGAPYWFRTNTGRVQVGWDIDSDPDPDIWRVLTAFLRDSDVDITYRNDVEAKALELGWDGSS